MALTYTRRLHYRKDSIEFLSKKSTTKNGSLFSNFLRNVEQG